MKFKDEYRKQNDKIHVREGLLDEIKMENVQRSRREREQKRSRRPWLIAIPTFAAAAAACVAIVVGINAGGKNAASRNDAKTAQSDYNYTAAYELAEASVSAEEPNAPITVASYDELGEIMTARRTNSIGSYYGGWYATDEAVAEEEMPAPEPAAPTAVEAPTGMLSMTNGVKGETITDGSEDRYSGTNNQVQGVDEADIVKTDGKWIYVLSRSDNKAYILAADGKDTKVVSSIKLRMASEKDSFWQDYSEMLLCGDRLYLLGTYYNWGDKVNETDRTYTLTQVYDISDRTAPKELSTLKQQGSYRTARLVDGMLVIVSDYHIWYWLAIDEMPVKEYCPKVVTNDASDTLAPGDIYVNPASDENGFAVITTINASDGTKFDEHKAVLGGCDTVYCSGSDLLIAANEYKSEQSGEQTDKDGKHFVKIVSGSYTNLFRFTIDGGKIEAKASATLPGTLLNQFSMDAYNGYYRFVVTRSDSEEIIWTDGIDTYEWNSSSDCELLVLDGDLKTVGKLENLAKDERVQSVRFMGDAAYFVTFRQVDPLFSVDLSDPQNPKVLSKLKIPGFSAYLHPFGEGKLLGIGYDADEEHGWTENVKLSMFDISDPANVSEAFKLSVKDVSYTSVQYNHKVVFVDVETGTVAFPADGVYLVFRADEKGFKEIGRIKTEDDYWFGDARGLFINDMFYVVGDSKVFVLSFESMEKLATVKLK